MECTWRIFVSIVESCIARRLMSFAVDLWAHYWRLYWKRKESHKENFNKFLCIDEGCDFLNCFHLETKFLCADISYDDWSPFPVRGVGHEESLAFSFRSRQAWFVAPQCPLNELFKKKFSIIQLSFQKTFLLTLVLF